MDFPSYLQNWQSLTQGYIFASDKQHYLNNEVVAPQDKKFFEILLNPISDNEDALYVSQGLSSEVKDRIFFSKILRELNLASTEQEKLKAIKNIKKHPTYQSFDFPLSVDVDVNTTHPTASDDNKPEKPKEKFETESSVKDVILKILTEDKENLFKLSEYGLRNFPLQKLKDLQQRHSQIIFSKPQIVKSLDPEHIAEFLTTLITKTAQMKHTSQEEQFPNQFFDMLSVEQIEALKTKLPKLFSSFNYLTLQFRQKYQQTFQKFQKIPRLSLQQKAKKRQLCIAVRDELKSTNLQAYDNVIEKITEQILLIDESNSNSDIDLFINYLKEIKSVNYQNFDHGFRNNKKEGFGKNKYLNRGFEPLTFLQSSAVGQDQIINGTIISLFKANNSDTLQKLSPFINQKYLIKEQAKVRLTLGLQKQMTNIHDIFTTDQLNYLKDRKQITFLPNNKKKFTIKDKVQLSIKLKNIKKLIKKIYVIDLEKQLVQNNRNIDQNINLKFLIPTIQEELFSKELVDPFEEIKYTFEIKDLQNQLGLFIVELEGDGVTSRAVIRKGTVVLDNRTTEAGHQLKFYDEEGKAIDNLVIWRDNKRIEVTNSYFIPYGPQASQNITIVYKKYAEQQTINIYPQQYTFSIDYLYHSQSFIVGNKAKVILHPVLKLYDKTISLNTLKNVNLKVAAINYQNITTSQTTQNIKFKDSEDYVLQFPIKSYIKTFAISVEAEIELLDKSKTKVTSGKLIQIDLEDNDNNFVDLYLEKDNEDYILKVRGKNGQNIPNVPTTLSYEQFGANFSFNKQLNTDENGKLELGRLSQVTKLSVTISNNGFQSTRNWKLNNYGQNINYGEIGFSNSKIYLKQGEKLSLPLPCELSVMDIILLKNHPTLRRTYHKTSDVKLCKDKLLIQNLEQGLYTLNLLRFNKKLEIVVIKGRQWISGKIIDQKNIIYKLEHKNQDFISLGDVNAQVKQNHIEYSIQILSQAQSLPEDMKLHIFAKNYIDSSDQTSFVCKPRQIPMPIIESLKIKQSNYYHNKLLSDETAYIINRKGQDAINGNNLEKPHIFLKRIQVRATQEKDQVLTNEGKYDDFNLQRAYAPQSHMMMDMADCYQSRSFAMGNYNQQGMYGYNPNINLNRKLNSHNNFLYRVGFVNPNLRKTTAIKVPLGYNQIVVYLFTKDSTLKRQYVLPSSKTQKLKLVHTAIKDENKESGWTMSREIYKISRDQVKEISRNSTWTTASLSNIVGFAKIQGISLPDWILAWPQYSPTKKLQIYDKQTSHQLNFYIFRNDKAFFQEVVRIFISNKVVKTFIDHYLLDNETQVLKYASTHLLSKLNAFEKALLVQKLKKYGKHKEAESIAFSMELLFKNIKQSNEEFKKFFETVLNAKKVTNEPSISNQPVVGMAMGSSMAGGLFGASAPRAYACPPPRAEMQLQSCLMDMDMMMMPQQMKCSEMVYNQCQTMPQKLRENYKAGFKETEKTRQYTETTYSGVKDPQSSSYLVPNSPFWAELAQHYNSNKSNNDFLSDKFSFFSQKIEYVLACSVISSQPQADFELANLQNSYQIKAKSSFLVFVRQVKSLPYSQSKTIVLNQRFFDPRNRYSYDQQGVQLQKQVKHFIVQKPYTLQTIITNISGSQLQIQLLMDIPEGSIPLKNHEETQILNLLIPAYNTQTFQREFYFPEEGKFEFYPANASRNKSIITKSASIDDLIVTKVQPFSELQTLDNILRSGTDEDIFKYIKTRNIFDPNIFDINLVYQKSKKRQFYNELISIFKERSYFNDLIWSFSLYHNDFDNIKQFIESRQSKSVGIVAMELPIFEYYPYYSSRVHKFVNQNKSTIRVKEFRQNYATFLYAGVFQNRLKDPSFNLTLIYYLILQDKIVEAKSIYSNVTVKQKEQYQIQYDYIDCFLDMYDGATTNYTIARKISQKYKNYPVLAWRKLFDDVYQALSKNQEQDSEESTKAEQVTFSTTLVNSGNELKINRPAQTKVTVNFYQIDLELYFSEYPFSDVTTFSAILPSDTVVLQGSQFKVERLQRKNYQKFKNVFVEVYEQKQNNAPKKISSFLWANPDIKVKVNQKQGTLKIFYGGKKCTTSYVKVYSRGSKGQRFSRDGYTDVASTFRYALDVKDVQEFAILVLTDYGGAINKVKPPSIY